MITMRAIARSPLMFGGDLATLDPFTRGLLSNGAVLEVVRSTACRSHC